MANSVATVASLEGQAWAKSADGTLRPLKVGDTVTAEEVVITATGARIELDFGDGKPVAISGGKEVLMDRDLWTELATDKQDAAVDNASVEQALTVLNEGGDLTTALEETAAGLEGGGTSEGHSFVELTRVVENTDPNAFNFGANSGDAGATSIASSDQINHAPQIDPQSFTGDEDTLITGQVIATDVENDALTYSLVGQPTNGTITLDPATGSFVYTPNANYNGPDSFIVTVTDDHGNSTTTTMGLTVTSVNDAPVSGDQSLTTLEDTPVAGQVVATDIEGDTLSYSISTAATSGTVTLNPATGAFVYTPSANFNGSDSFVVTVADGNGGSTTSRINIGVTPVNDAPESADQNLTTLEDTPVSGEVVASDVDGDTLTYAISTTATNGTVTLNPVTGAFVYTPSANYNGSDSFVVTIADGNGGTTTSTINIGVTPVNDAPVSADQNFTTPEDTALSGSVVASDIEGDTLTYSISSTVSNGTVTLNPVTGAFVYTPNANYNGSDSFEVTIEDGQGGTTTSTINIGVTPVNDAPVSAGLSLTTSEDTAVSGQISASDIDGDTLAYTVSGQPANGSVSLDVATGSFVYTPNSNYNGSDSFTVTISDGNGGTTSSLVSIGISAVNDGPTAANLSLTTAEDVAVNGAISANDPDGDTLSYSVTGNPANGTVVLNPATGSFSYTPNTGYNGSDSFVVRVSDGKGGVATSTVSIGVNSLNDAPVASDLNLTTSEDTAVSGAISASDPESDPLSYSVTGNPSNGTVVLNPSTGTFVYTPNSNYKGSDSFTVTISDGNGGTTTSLVSIGISSQNDVPVLSVTSTNNFTEDAPSNAVGSVVATYTTSDADGDTVTVTLSDTVNYALDGAGNVTLTAAGLALVNAGTDLPAFTLTPNDGTINGTARNVDPAVTPETSGPVVSSITMSDVALKIGDTALVTITFSEAVTNFANADVTVEQGTLSALSSADGGITWTGTFTPTSNIEDTSNLISVANTYTDLAGNAGTAATGPSYSVDTIAPTATISLSDSALIGGETATVTISFSEAVTGLTTADFTVGSGALSNLASSDGGVTWTATFTPSANTSDASNVISLTNNSYTDVAGNLGSGASSANYTVETSGPVVSSITMSDVALKIGDTALVTITFSEAVTNFGNADVTVEQGTLSALSSADGGITWTGTFTPTSNIEDTSNIISVANSYTDLAGNAGTAATGPSYSVDTVAPTATISLSDSALIGGETATVTISFSEAVTGLTTADFTVGSGALSNLVTSDGGVTWTATFTPSANTSDASNVISLTNNSYTDVAGNLGSGASSANYTVETSGPVVSSITMSDTALKIGDTALVTITFSEAVTNFGNADVTVEQGTLSALSSADGGITWTGTFTPTSNIEDASNIISVANSYTDLAGNAGTAATGPSYSVDTVAPTATISLSDSALIGGETATVTISFSEAVTGLTTADFTVGSGALSNLVTSDGGVTWTATFTPSANTSDASNVISLTNNSYTDVAGNLGSGASSANYTVETSGPVVSSITMSDTALKIGDTALVTITFSEAVTNFGNADVTVEQGTLSALSSADGGITWTGTFTPTSNIEDASNIISVANSYTDLAGNAGTAATGPSYSVDTVAPTATISLSDSALIGGETATVTISFSEAVTGLTTADFTVGSGALSNLVTSDGGVTWTATFTPSANTSDASNVISLTNNSYTDVAGNLGSGASSANYTVETSGPVVSSITMSDTALKIGDTALVTITFSEAVTNFGNADVTVEQGTLSALSSADGGITWTGTFTPTSNIEDASNIISVANSYTDLAGNAGTAATGPSYSVDTVAPTATISLSDSALIGGETATVTISFSEAVTGLTTADFTVGSGALSNLVTSDGGVTWTATFTPSANTSDASNVISLTNNSYTDVAGNLGSGASSANYTVETSGPVVSSITMSDTALKIGDTALVTITFSEAVTNFGNADVTVEQGTLSALSSADGGITWTGTFTPTSNIEDASNIISVANSYTDLAGNAGTAATGPSYSVDTVAPTATISLSDSALIGGETATVTISFSEAVTGLTTADFTVGSGALSNLVTSDGGVTWTATFTPSANTSDASNVISLTNNSYTDVAGNLGSGASSANYTVETSGPVVSSITMSDTALKIGDTALVTITFSEAVTNFGNADVTVEQGTLSALSSADGGITWTGTFTPTSNIEDASNIISVANSYTDLAGNAGTAATGPSYSVDTVAPTATISLSDSALIGGETATVTISFSEAVTGLTTADFTVGSGALSNLVTSDGGVTWTATFTPSANTSDASNVISLTNNSYTDVAGNLGSGASSANYTVETSGPVVSSITMSDTALKIGDTALVTITFSEAVTNFGNADVTVEQGTLSALSSADGGITWTGTFTPTSNIEDASNIISVANSYTDLAGNAGTAATGPSYSVDTVAPTATISLSDSALIGGETATVTISFSEAVTGLTTADFTVGSGALSNLVTSDGGVTWTATFTPSANTSDASNVISLTNNSYTDVAGNLGSGASSANYTVETSGPVVSSITMSDTALKIGDTALVTITFSEAVTNFGNADVTVEQGTLSALSSADGGITWTGTFTPTSNIEDASNIISVANSYTDLAGNAGTAATGPSYSVDTVAPTATISLSDSALIGGETATVTISFSEAVTGLTTADFTVGSGALSNLVTSDGGVTWTATFTPSANTSDASNVISLTNNSYTDVAGNLGSGASSANYTVETSGPVVSSITMSDTALKIGDTALVTITFSEAVTNFGNADVTVEQGTLSALSSADGGITWTGTFTPTSNIEDASNIISVANSYTDLAGNAGTAATGPSYSVDTVAPTATISLSDSALIGGETATVTISFSEAVTGLTTADFTVGSGALSNLVTSDGGVTWTATFTPSANTSDASNVISLTNNSYTDVAGNLGSGASSANYTVETSGPVVSSITMSDTALKIGDTALVTITFSEAVTNFGNADVTVEQGTLSALSSADGGITWTGTFTPTSNIEDASNIISVANSYTDLAGNAGTAATGPSYSVDTVAPTATISLSDSALIGGETATVTISFSEAVTGLTTADFTVGSGALSNLVTSDGGVTWTATFTPSANTSDASNVISLTNNSYTDVAGNLGSGASSANYTVETSGPVVSSITMSDTALKIGDTALVTITFSEAVTNFGNADVTVEQGTLSALSSADGGITWTGTFTPTSNIEDASNIISVANSYTDLAGNAGTAATGPSYSVDTVAPTATISLSDSALIGGETATVTISFSEAVTGLTTADFTVGSGALSNLVTSDGGVTWTATFTPSANTSDASNVISLTNNSYTDVAGNLGSGASSANYTVETSGPVVSSITMSDTALKIGDTALVTITFSEAVTNFGNADVTVEQGTLSALSSADGGITWTGTFTPTSNIEDASNIISVANSYTDLAGNAGTAATGPSYSVDTVAPTATISLSDSALIGGETATVTISFSEAVTGLTTADFTVGSGALSNLVTSDGGVTWTATFTPSANTSDASNVISLTNNSYTDVAGNLGSGASSANYTVETSGPVVSSITMSDTALKIGDTALVTITFSEAVTNFGNADVTVEQGTLSALSSADGGITWTGTFTPTSNIEDASNIISVANSYTDLAGNAGTAATGPSYSVDTVAPTATISLSDSALIGGETATVTISFSEAVTGLTTADFTVGSGALSNLVTSDGGITWTATFTPAANTSDASNVISLTNNSYTDVAGNLGSGASSANYTVETSGPVVSSITMSDVALKIGDTALVTITFSEAVTSFANADVTVEQGTLSALSSADGGITWTGTFTPTSNIEDTSNLISVANTYTDLAGNAGTAATGPNYSVDTVAPTATISLSDSALIGGETATVTITFSEAVTGLTTADFTVGSGALSNLVTSDGGVTWTATFTPAANTSDASNVISLTNNSYTDVAGNLGSGASSANYTVETSGPVVSSITLSDVALKIGDTALVTITFSEAVTSFANADVTVEQGTLSALSSADGGITWTGTFTPTSNIEDTSNLISVANTYTDLAGNAGTAATGPSYSVDTIAPTATISLSDSALIGGETATVTISFSEAVTGLTTADFTVGSGALSNLVTSDGGITWTATFTPAANTSDASNVISLTNNSYTDVAGNLGSGASSANYTVETSGPVVSSITMSDVALKIGDTALVTITFSEAVTSFANADVTVEQGTLSALSSADGGITWTGTFTPTSNIEDTSNLISVANTYTDLAGNAGTAATGPNYSVDTVAPTATISLSDSALIGGETATVTITFSEAVTGLTTADFTVGSGALSNLVTSDGGTTWTATFTPSANTSDASNVISLTNNSYTDVAGNLGSGASSANYTVETSGPVVSSITMSDVALKIGDTALVTITFSEAVTSFANADVTVEQGTLSALSSADGGITWTGTFTPTSNIEDTSNLISVANSYTDLAGNAGTAATGPNYSVDTVAPTATISLSDSALIGGETATVTITFSEAVTGLTTADFTVGSGALSNLVTSDGGTTWTATFTPSANTSDASNVISLTNNSYTDVAGNLGSGASSANYTVETSHAPVAVNDPASGSTVTTGLLSEYYSYNEGTDGGNITSLAQINTFIANHSPTATFVAKTFDYGSDNLFNNDLGRGTNLQSFLGSDAASLSADPGTSTDAIIRMFGAVELAAGTYNFRIRGDDGYQVKVDGVAVATVDQIQSPTGTVHTQFTVGTSGVHSIEILYWDQGGQAVFKVELSDNNGTTYDLLSAKPTTYSAVHTMNEDTSWTVPVATLLANDSDVDGDVLTVVSVQNAVNGTVSLSGGNVTFTPNANFYGLATYTYTISDGHGGTDTALVSMNVQPLNDLAVVSNVSANASGIAFTASDVDVGTTLALTSPFAAAFSNPTINNGSATTLTVTEQTTAVSGTLRVTDATAPVDVIGLSIGTSGANTFNSSASTTTAALYGFGGDDVLTGGSANDLLVGGTGNDTLTGGAGLDTFNVASGTDTITDLGLGGADALVVVSGATANATLGAAYTATAATTNAGTVNLSSNGFNVNLGSVGGSVGYSVTNTGSAATFTGSGFADSLTGGSGADTLIGGGGNDTLSGGLGNDTLTGGTGNDTYVFGLTDGTDSITDTAGTDAITISASGAALTGLNFFDSGDNLVITINGQTITVNNHFASGTNYVETLSFTGGATYRGFALGNTSYAVSTDDSGNRDGTSGNDIVTGDTGNNTLNGNSGNDLLFGGAGNDTLNGGDGLDLLVGGAGNDSLNGGAGADTFVWNLADKGTTAVPANDTVAGFTTGSGGDVLSLSDLLQGENSGNLTNYLHFTSDGTNTTVSISSSGSFNGSNYGTAADQTILLNGVNLTGTDTTIINLLKTNSNLITD